jgi:hypothetical protein
MSTLIVVSPLRLNMRIETVKTDPRYQPRLLTMVVVCCNGYVMLP